MGGCVLCGSNAIINRQDIASRTIYNCPICGVFVVSDLAEREVVQKSDEIMAFLMSRKLANETDTVLISFEKAKVDKDYVQLTVNQIVEFFPESFTERMEMSLKNLELLSGFPGAEVLVDDLTKMSAYFYVHKKSVDELNFVIRSMQKADLIETNYYSGAYFPCGVTISPNGWDKLHELNMAKSKRNIIFACAPRSESEHGRYFIEALRKTAKECGFHSVQSSEGRASSKISNELIAGIKSGDVVVCDFTELLGESYYSAALARGLGKLCILTCHESVKKKLQIDTDQISVIFWDKQETLHMELLSALRAAL